MLKNEDQLVKSFVPRVLQSRYSASAEQVADDLAADEQVVLLWIDVCNFSPLCSRLMKDTLSGVEKITGILHQHYDFVLNAIDSYGGQPLFFAGDGLMSAWPVGQSDSKEAVEFAAACAYQIINNRKTTDDKHELLSVHAIVANGPWQTAELQGAMGRKLVSFYGEVFSELSAASKNKAPNQVLITNRALAALDSSLKSEKVENDTSILFDSTSTQRLPTPNIFEMSGAAIEKLKLFVPRTLNFPLNPEHFKWIAEIRPVTILFVRLPNSGKTSAENLRQLRESVALSTPLVEKYDGLLNQVWMDEKESNMLLCFGPPPSAHFDNPERSVHLGFEIHHLLKKSGIQNSVGISTGMAYCGILGNDILRQYTVIGDVVNLSAHIAGIKRNEIFCDKATYNVANKTVNFSGQMMATVKGHKEPISLFIPKSFFAEEQVLSQEPVSVGRKNEMDLIMAAFKKAATGKSECIIIEGESGMGKSLLLEEFLFMVPEDSATKVIGTGDFVLYNTPYASLRHVMAALLGISHPDTESFPVNIYDDLTDRFGQQACLLNIVLNTAIEDSDKVKTMTSTQRVQATHDFLLAILKVHAATKPVILVFDDARWVDEFTLAFIRSVNKNVDHCLVLFAYQVTEGLNQVQLLKDDGAMVITLKGLNDRDIETLICEKLGVNKISASMADVVISVAKGNPFFCIELAASFLNNELLLFENNSCTLVSNADLKKFALPETVRGSIRRRIDRLGQGSQISLKVGSVIGKRFVEKIICNVYPIPEERALVPSYLQEVEHNGLLNPTMVDNLNGYLFNSATTVEVAYEMTLGEQRRQLHRDIAVWYEDNFGDNLQAFYVRLANHWVQAGEMDSAVSYFEKEAVRLFRLGFVREALDAGLEGIRYLNTHIPRDLPSIMEQISENMNAIAVLMKDKAIGDLAFHKISEDQTTDKVIRLLLSLAPFAHQSQQGELFALMTIICQRLTLENGNGPSAAEVYAMYSIIFKTLTGDTETALTWSNLSLEIDKRNGFTQQARVLFIHCWFIALWKTPLKDLIPLAAIGADAGFRTGDILFACFDLSLEVVLKTTSGRNLREVIQTATNHINRNNNAVINAAFHLRHEKQVAKALQGLTSGPTSLTNHEYDEEIDIASICKTDLFNQVGYYLVSKLKLHVHFGNWDEALKWGAKSIPLLPAFANQPGEMDLEQYYTIAALYKAGEGSEDATTGFFEIARKGIVKLKAWAALCPRNFLHKANLVEAIMEGFSGDAELAEKLFRTAAEGASAEGYIQDCGLAFEHLVRMNVRLGLPYAVELKLAMEAYQQWGAAAKVSYLQEQFGD